MKKEHGIVPSEKWLCDWLVSSCELIDRYQPSSLFDSMDLFHCMIKNITLLGSDEKITYSQDKKTLTVRTPNKVHSKMPICFKIEVD